MEDCIFCKIIKGEIPCSKVYEDENIIAFNDINPAAPVHFLVVPKRHISSIMELQDGDSDIINQVMKIIKEVAEKTGIDKAGYRIVNNIGENGGQTVPHIHFHVLGGRFLQWPPG